MNKKGEFWAGPDFCPGTCPLVEVAQLQFLLVNLEQYISCYILYNIYIIIINIPVIVLMSIHPSFIITLLCYISLYCCDIAHQSGCREVGANPS